MLRLFSCLLLFFSVCSGQVPPYGPTQSPFIPSVSPSVIPTILSTIPTVNPFNPAARPFVPPGFNNRYNSPYYNPNPTAGPAIPILTYTNDHVGDGTYSFSYSTADGKQAQESGFLKDAYIDNAGEPQGTQVVQGSYAYIAPDGTPIQVSYVADENGFRPSGVHIPADGKGLPPAPIIDGKDNRNVGPFNRFNTYEYNRYNPYNYSNRLNKTPFDPRYQNPFNNRYNSLNPLNNPYRSVPPYGPSTNGIAKEEPKRD